jgi:hypothetical protein
LKFSKARNAMCTWEKVKVLGFFFFKAYMFITSWFIYLDGIRVWTQGLTLARQAQYHLNHMPIPLCFLKHQNCTNFFFPFLKFTFSCCCFSYPIFLTCGQYYWYYYTFVTRVKRTCNNNNKKMPVNCQGCRVNLLT